MFISHALSHVLAIAADIYTPVLLIAAVIDVVLRWRSGSRFYSLRLAGAVFVVYGWMFLDNYFQLWAHFGLDYSTHSAAALALVVSFSCNKSFSTKMLCGLSLLVYGCLMFVLNYHSWSDMFTTVAVVGTCLAPAFLFRQYENKF